MIRSERKIELIEHTESFDSSLMTILCKKLADLVLAAIKKARITAHSLEADLKSGDFIPLHLDLKELNKYGVYRFHLSPDDFSAYSKVKILFEEVFGEEAKSTFEDFRTVWPNGIKIKYTDRHSLPIPNYESRAKLALLSIYLATKNIIDEYKELLDMDKSFAVNIFA